jgi:hypothetical protein
VQQHNNGIACAPLSAWLKRIHHLGGDIDQLASLTAGAAAQQLKGALSA